MADDIKILIGVDATPVERAVRVMDNLEAELRRVERAEKAGLITKDRAKAETDRLTASMQQLKTVANGSVSDFNRFEKGLYNSGKAARRNEVALQQAGYQFQDFIVQVQGGTNPLIAFSQQGSQLAGFFAGPWGAAIGLGIAAVGALGTAIMGVMGQVKSFEDQLKETTTSLENYFDLIGEHKESFGDTFDLATKNLVKTSEAYKDLLAIAKIEAFDGINKLNDSLTKSVLSASYLKTEIEDVGDLINEGFVAKVSAALGGKAGTEIRGMYNALVQLKDAPTLDAQYQAALKVREIFKQNVDVTGELTDQQKQFWKELSTTIQKMELLGAATNLANEKLFDQNELDLMVDGINTYFDAYVAGQKGAYDESVRLAAKAKAKKEEMTKNEIGVMTDSINTYLEAYVAGQKGAYDETVRISAFAAKMREDSAKKEQSYANKAKEDQIEILKLEGKIGEARQLSVKLAGEKAAQEVYSKFTQEELLRMTEAEKSVLAQAAGEAAKNAEEAEKTAIALDNAKNKAQGLADNLKEAVSAMSGLSSFGDSLDKALAVSIAKVQALKAGADAAVAGDIAGKRAELSQKAKEGLAKGVPLATVMAEIDSSAAKIDKLEASERTRKKLEEDARNAAKKGSTADSLKSGTEYIERVLKPEIELRQKSLFLSDEQQKRAKFEFDLRQKLDKYKDKASEKEIAAVMALYDQTVRLERASRLVDYAQGQMEDFFMSVVDGTSTIEDAFKGMLRNILLEIYRQEIVKPMAEGISGFVKSFLFSAKGNVFQGGSQVKAFANGGVVSGPTMFPMTSGVGVMGEAGPEAIMPLKRGANGKLGVEMHGGSSQQVIVNQSFNFSANGDESVKKIIAQAAPQIAQMTQQKIMDSRRRGGQMKATFS